MASTQDMRKRKRKLDALRAMDLTGMGYEARVRHRRQLQQAEQDHALTLAKETETVSHGGCCAE
ncbi:MAG: hypothetical protein V3W34_17865 [Phycisphaerae bacterium]